MNDRPSSSRKRGGAKAMWTMAAVLGLVFAGSTLPTPLYVLYRKEFGFSEIVLTLIYAAYVAGSLAALIFLGRISDQIGRRRATLPALAIAAISTLVFIFTVNTAMLFAARVLMGLAIGIISGAITAWVSELHPRHDNASAALIVAATNVGGLGLGPLVSGLLAQYAPWPLKLTYLLYLAMLVPLAVLTWKVRETVREPIHSWHEISLRPRIGVPRGIWAKFFAPAATAFGTLALSGFYSALAPGLLSRQLHEHSHAVGGAVVLEMFFAAVVAILITIKWSSRTAMLWGLAILLPSLAMLVLAAKVPSLTILLGGTALGGISFGLGYRGSLQIVNQIAPGGQRAEVLSTYFVVCYVGVALPVIGIGVISQLASPFIANLTFASTIAAFTIFALIAGIRYVPAE